MDFNWGDLLNYGTQLAIPYFGSKASHRAADATVAGNHEAAQILNNQFNTTRGDMAPYREAGGNALDWLTKLNTPGALKPGVASRYVTSLPGYQFASDQLQRALTNKAAASGGRFGTRALSDMVRTTNSSLLQPTYNNWMGHLQSLAGMGENANTAMAQYGANNAQQQAGLVQGSADAQAGGDIAQSQLWGNALSQLSQQVQQQPMRNAETKYLLSLANRNNLSGP